MTMQVVNRKGEREDVRFDAIHEKLSSLTGGLDNTMNYIFSRTSDQLAM